MAYKMKGFSGFKPESVPDVEGEVNLSKSSGLGPRTSFGGSKNPELDKKAPTKSVPIAAVATAADMAKKKRGDTAKKLGKVSEGLKKAGRKMQNAAAERPSPAAGIAAAAASMNFSRKDSPAQMSDKRKLKKAERLYKKIAKSSKAGKSTSKRNLKRASKANKLRGY